MKRLGFIIMFLLFCHAVVQASQEGDDNVQDVMFGKALECYNLAISCDPEAQYQLATCYHGGYGVEENTPWLSQYMLGLCYANGEGVTKDSNKVIEWFKKSSRQGHRLAQYILMRIGETW